MKSFRSYQKQRILLSDGSLANGKYSIEGDLTIRVKNGFLNDEISEDGHLIPAIMTDDSTHVEHWKDGVLHCEIEPAIIDNLDNYEEWWLNGKFVNGTRPTSSVDEKELIIQFKTYLPRIEYTLCWKDSQTNRITGFTEE